MLRFASHLPLAFISRAVGAEAFGDLSLLPVIFQRGLLTIVTAIVPSYAKGVRVARARILVADDHEEIRNTIVRLLKRQNWIQRRRRFRGERLRQLFTGWLLPNLRAGGGGSVDLLFSNRDSWRH